MKTLLVQSFGLTILLLNLWSCQQDTQVFEKEHLKTSSGSGDGVLADKDKLPGIGDNVVCDPFSLDNGSSGMLMNDTTNLSLVNGLKGEIRLLDDQSSNFSVLRNNLANYMDPKLSFALPAEVYVGNLDVPTRMFDEGFPYKSGELIKDTKGNDLIEWFSLRFKAKIRPEVTGDYQFATISDDGVLLSINGKPVVSNTNIHAPVVDCSEKMTSIRLEKGKDTDIEIQYFQGPRYHIALQLFWRKVDTANLDKLSYSSCKTNKSPIADGFSIIPADRFFLGGNLVNPCAVE